MGGRTAHAQTHAPAHDAPHAPDQTIQTADCPSGTATLALVHGDGGYASYSLDGCDFYYYAEYTCDSGAQPTPKPTTPKPTSPPRPTPQAVLPAATERRDGYGVLQRPGLL